MIVRYIIVCISGYILGCLSFEIYVTEDGVSNCGTKKGIEYRVPMLAFKAYKGYRMTFVIRMLVHHFLIQFI
jgi:hypothetical protein